METLSPKPRWLKAVLPGGEGYEDTLKIVKEHKLHTVCEEARCPNLGECWGRGTATLMILGDVCTRACGFCAIKTGRPTELDTDEPARVAEAVKLLRLKHVVITSVARDELKDGGSEIWAQTILKTRAANPQTTLEVLIPDFLGDREAWARVFATKPDILNHNIETVQRLSRRVRSAATWERSLQLLQAAGQAGLVPKSGIMLGLGESDAEVEQALRDLRAHGVRIVTIGQYLQPSPEHLKVVEFVHPDKFDHWKRFGLELGFEVVESGPMVRSSYHAEEQALKFTQKEG